MLCMNGEVTINECDSGRGLICAQNESGFIPGFSLANCRKNYWDISVSGTGGCMAQNNSEDCNDNNDRDCKWINYREYFFNETTGLQAGSDDDDKVTGVCVPLYPVGFNRSQDKEIIGGEMCTAATSYCLVMYEKKGIFGDYECKENCYCDPEDSDYDNFAANMNNICTSIGDCGIKKNYFNKDGKYKLTDEEIFKKERYKEGDPD